MDHIDNLADRARELAERAAKTSDPAMATAAQTYATLALAAATQEQNAGLRLVASWMDDMTSSLGSTIGNLTEQVEGLRYKI